MCVCVFGSGGIRRADAVCRYGTMGWHVEAVFGVCPICNQLPKKVLN